MINKHQESYETRLEKALFIVSHPESLLTDETQLWLEDKANSHLYLQLLAVKEKALAEDKSQQFDTQAAWEKFSQEHPALLTEEGDVANTPSPSGTKILPLHNWRKWIAVAAISIPIILLAGIAPIYHLTHKAENEKPTATQELSQKQTSNHQNENTEEIDSLDQEKEEGMEDMGSNYFHFENASLESIMKEVASWYHMEVVFENEQARGLRFSFWASKQEPASQTIEMLNEIGKARIIIKDNKIIIQ